MGDSRLNVLKKWTNGGNIKLISTETRPTKIDSWSHQVLILFIPEQEIHGKLTKKAFICDSVEPRNYVNVSPFDLVCVLFDRYYNVHF